MILHGNSRAGASDLAQHLLRDDENDHVKVHQVRGFMAEDVEGAFQEIDALSRATRCKKFMFSLSLSPPKEANCTDKDFESAIDKAEKELGLTGQPRVIVFHEKGDQRDRHAHAVWSRIDGEEMKAIPLPYNKMKMRDVSRELYIQHGWDMPRGLINTAERNPLNYTLEEYQQAKRNGKDARQVKAAIQDSWALSDSPSALSNALNERGFKLAKGDRRGFVAVDSNGEIYSLPKWIGVKTKDVRDRIGKDYTLKSTDETKAEIAEEMKGKMLQYAFELRSKNDLRKQDAKEQRAELVEKQRTERVDTQKAIETRQIEEAQARQEKYRHGLKGLWDWMRGENSRVRKENELEASAAKKRDQFENDELVQKQKQQREWTLHRQNLQKESLQNQHREVAEDHNKYSAMEEASREARREEFMNKRLAESQQQPSQTRDIEPEI